MCINGPGMAFNMGFAHAPAMSNLLTPGGLLPHQEQQVLLKAIIHHLTMNPMPDHVGAWIQTEKCTH
jgi:hypothetical protein